MTCASVSENVNFYLENKEEFLEKYRGKYIILVNKEVKGAYDAPDIATKEALAMGYNFGDFAVQLVAKGDGSVNFVGSLVLL